MSDDLDPQAGTITSSDGTVLEAVIDRPTPTTTTRAVAAIAHPHPQYGGDLHNNVVGALQRGLVALGAVTVRFNFRGVGASGGTHSGGTHERADYLAALDAAAALDTTVPLFACGYSFGADVALTSAHGRLAAWIVIAPPLRLLPDELYVAAVDARPKHLIVGVHDQHASPEALRAITAGWRNVIVHPVEMADHFFAGATSRVAEIVTQIVTDEQ